MNERYEAPRDCSNVHAPVPPPALQDQLFSLMRAQGTKQIDIVHASKRDGQWQTAVKTVEGADGTMLQATLVPINSSKNGLDQKGGFEISSIMDLNTGQQDYYKRAETDEVAPFKFLGPKIADLRQLDWKLINAALAREPQINRGEKPGEFAGLGISELSVAPDNAIRLKDNPSPQMRISTEFNLNDENGQMVAKFNPQTGALDYETGWHSNAQTSYRTVPLNYSFDNAGKLVDCPPQHHVVQPSDKPE